MKIFLLLPVLFSFLIACTDSGIDLKKPIENIKKEDAFGGGGETTASEVSSRNNKATPAETAADVNPVKKIIQHATLRFQVNNVDSATGVIRQFTSNHDGYISSSNLNTAYNQIENKIMIRVPAGKFDALLNEIESLSLFLDNRIINTQDLTSEYIDLESRLKTKLEVKSRYESILRDKAKSVEDVLDAERQIGAIQEEIEAAQGRLRYIASQVGYSTIELTCYQQIIIREQPEVAKSSFFAEAGKGFENGWNILKALLIALINLWPIMLLAIAACLIFRKRIFRKEAVLRRGAS